MEDNLGTKSCSKCGGEYPLTAEYFYRNRRNKDGFRGQCKECVEEYKKQYREDNKEKIARYQEQYHKKYREENKEKLARYQEQYRAKNKKKIARYKEQYYEENKEKIARYQEQHYEENKEKYARYHKQYFEENKEKISEYNKQYSQSEQGRKNKAKSKQNRRAREAQLPNTLTTEEYEDNLKYFNYSCAYCGCELDENNHHMEHVVPISKGGGTTQKNIIPSCESCNSSKHVKTLADWYRFSDDFNIEKLAQIAKHLAQFTDWVVRAE